MAPSISSLLLGVVQGITEWLPISSTAHLLLVEKLLPLSLSAGAKEFFFVAIQFASILAVVILFFKELNPVKAQKLARLATLNLWVKIIIATIPAAVMGVLFDDLIDAHLQGPVVIALSLAIYGILYILLETNKSVRTKARLTTTSELLTYKQALYLGLFQVLALIPGTSRSGSTILGGLLLGLSRPFAAHFSFFMAIPVIAGATLLKALKIGLHFSASEWIIIGLGSVAALGISLVVMKRLLAFLKSHTFIGFGFYRIILAVIILLWGI
ncbi:MAG: undecaprenyl-diphosphate phosphatase [Sphaerochaeta sp.]